MGVWYTTRETVKTALDIRETARSNAQVDREIESASRGIEGNLHRVFYPTIATRYFDFPSISDLSWPWVLWLHDNEVVSVSSLVSGPTTISPVNYFLEPVNDGPPFNRIEINLSSRAGFDVGATYQRSIALTGVFGFDVNTAPAGALAAAIVSTSATTCSITDNSLIGVGHIIQIDSERMIVTGKTMLTTGQTGSITASQADVSVAVSNGAAFAVDEVLLIDSERIRIIDIAGNTLTVKRAWDGSTLAAHVTATLYALRTLTVTRGALGTTAVTHLNAAPVLRHVIPGPVENLCVAESLNSLLQEESGYARTVGSGDNVRNASGAGLADMRRQAFTSHGRKMRTWAV